MKRQGRCRHIDWISSCSFNSCNEFRKHNFVIHFQLPVSRLPFLILSIVYTTVLFGDTAFQHFLLGSEVWDLGIFK